MCSNPAVTTPEIPISWGELIDKITILEIKRERLTAEMALANVQKELSLLKAKADIPIETNLEILFLKEQLFLVNKALWNIEDKIRQKEAAQEFDADFIELARSVYRQNDQRAIIKREINIALSSELTEEKSYLHITSSDSKKLLS